MMTKDVQKGFVNDLFVVLCVRTVQYRLHAHCESHAQDLVM